MITLILSIIVSTILGICIKVAIDRFSAKDIVPTKPMHEPIVQRIPLLPIPPPILSSTTDGEPPVFTIVLTGGPCGGKSTALTQLFAYFKPLGYEIFMVPEAATILFTGGAKYSPDMDQGQLVAFQSSLIKAMISLEDSFRSVAKSLGKPSIIICDRGTMDCAAYMDPLTWQLMLDTNGWTNEILRDARYDAIVHLVTAADGAEKFYITDAVRRETPARAREIDLRLRKMWLGHSRVSFLDNSTGFAQKIQRCVSFISKIIGAPVPTKTQRKWQLSKSPEIPTDLTVCKYLLEQTYLVGNDDVESRIERKIIDNRSTYVLSRKRWSPTKDTFAIVERTIGPREYMALRTQADPNRISVQKQIQRFFWEGHILSIVEYTDPTIGIKFVQLETEADNQKVIEFPSWLSAEGEVTGNPDFTSYKISKDYVKN